MLLNCGVGEDSWESLGLQGDPTRPSSRKSVLNIHWKDWCWCWNSNTLATWCQELTHLKRPWCWERLKAGGEGDDRGWYGWMASLTRRTWVWVSSRSWWWTGNPGMLQSIGLQRVRHDWATELNWIWLSRSFLKFGLSCDLLSSRECKGSGDVTVLNLDFMWSWFCSLLLLCLCHEILILTSLLADESHRAEPSHTSCSSQGPIIRAHPRSAKPPTELRFTTWACGVSHMWTVNKWRIL